MQPAEYGAVFDRLADACDPRKVKQLLSYVFFGISLVIAYQAYENSRLRPDTEELARREACTIDSSCLLHDAVPKEQRTGPTSRRYEWRTTIGPVTVTCQRRYIFFGTWGCESERGGFGTF